MYKLNSLPYLYQDLEPYIDTHTIGVHYHKHHQNYLNKLNLLLQNNNYDYRYNIYELLYHINEFKEKDREDILFNLGGVLKHDLYWKSINPNHEEPKGKLKEQIIKQYNSLENFFTLFKESALKLKGSGYTFLILKNNGMLDIINLPNQDTPLSFGCIPLFNIDMWEHAYYLNYQNNKQEYLDNFWQILNFKYANDLIKRIS